jgi:hypothetical protein
MLKLEKILIAVAVLAVLLSNMDLSARVEALENNAIRLLK